MLIDGTTVIDSFTLVPNEINQTPKVLVQQKSNMNIFVTMKTVDAIYVRDDKDLPDVLDMFVSNYDNTPNYI